MRGVLLQACLRHVLPLPLHIPVGKLRGINGHPGHVIGRHMVRRKAGSALLRGEMSVRLLLRRVDCVRVVDAVLVAGGRFWCVQAGLGSNVSWCRDIGRMRRASHTWIKFLPSALVTRG